MSEKTKSHLIKAADYVAQFIAEQGIREVFAITGGASIHLIHAIAERHDVTFVCPHHEQAGAMAADAYARISGGLGCAVATSGPGATNLITGIACAWFDSIPTLYLTGQVTRFRFKGDTGVRQMGFQETDIVSMVKPITKLAVLITDTAELRYELERAVHIARSGRPGPVLVDIPDDLQREMIDPSALRPFLPADHDELKPTVTRQQIESCLALIAKAERPVLVLGGGVRLAGAADLVPQLVRALGFPVCPSWAAADMVPANDPQLAGTFGTHGTRAGNFTIQNADLVLAIGARLSTRETGSPLSAWAREAKTIIVDIDAAELGKFPTFGKKIDLPINADARQFIEGLLATQIESPDLAAWQERVIDWKSRYPVRTATISDADPVDPYEFVASLSRHLQPDDVIVTDTGCAVAWMLQGFQFKPGQRLIHAFNNTPMGYGLPGAIGAAFALGGKRRVICVAGDGSTMMNLQELSTIAHHDLPVKLFLIDNDGYAMVQQTQEQWLGGRHYASAIGAEGGMSFPDFRSVAAACGLATANIEKNGDIDLAISATLQSPGGVLCNVRIPATSRVIPQSRFGYPIEDSEPLLPRDEFLSNMIVQPLPISRVTT